MLPPAYPTAVLSTPGSSQKSRSAPQKQPMATTTCSAPGGNGGVNDVPRTRCGATTGIGSGRPGRTAAGSGIEGVIHGNRTTEA